MTPDEWLEETNKIGQKFRNDMDKIIKKEGRLHNYLLKRRRRHVDAIYKKYDHLLGKREERELKSYRPIYRERDEAFEKIKGKQSYYCDNTCNKKDRLHCNCKS